MNIARAVSARRLRHGIAFAAIGATAAGFVPPAYADDVADAGAASEITVTGRQQASIDLAKRRLEIIPGGASIVDSNDVSKGKSATVTDILAFQPGVYVQQVGGNDAIKLSIRGSGLNSSPGNMTEGIKWMFDGIGLTGPGGTSYELFEPLGLNYTEVLRGANAFDYGAVTLGGAVNFVSQNGRTNPGLQMGVQGGSFGYVKGQLAYGGQSGKADYYISFVGSRRDGFQDQTFKRSRGVSANFGYQITPGIETRFYLRYAKEYHDQSGALTLAQIRSNPRQTSAAFLVSQSNADKYGTILLGNKTTFHLDDRNVVEAGLLFDRVPQHIYTKSVSPSDSNYTDLNLSVRYTNQGEVFGLPSRTSFGWFYARHLIGTTTAYAVSGAGVRRLTKRNDFTGSFDNTLSLGNTLDLRPYLQLTTGVSAIEVERNIRIAYTAAPINAGQSSRFDYDKWTVAPRVGLILKPGGGFELFGNYSESVNPVASWGYSPSTYSTTLNYVKPLVNQRGWTGEIGARFHSARVDASISLYRSWIRHEYLIVELAQATATSSALDTGYNASPTIHQGVEAGFSATLWKQGPHAIVTRNSYTYNDFHFRHDATFGANTLPGAPHHIYQGGLEYDHASGFYLGASLQVTSRIFIDYANSVTAPSYTLVGARGGYRAPNGRWTGFIDLTNLSDRHYVAAVSPVYNAGGKDSATLYPGDGRAVVAGATLHF